MPVGVKASSMVSVTTSAVPSLITPEEVAVGTRHSRWSHGS